MINKFQRSFFHSLFLLQSSRNKRQQKKVVYHYIPIKKLFTVSTTFNMKKYASNFNNTEYQECTIGSAICIMEANVVKKLGIKLPFLKEGSNEISRCAYIISMAFFHTIYKDGVGKKNWVVWDPFRILCLEMSSL